MIARGWVPDSSKSEGYKYPNQPGQSSSNHTAQFEGMNKDGSVHARDQHAVDNEVMEATRVMECRWIPESRTAMTGMRFGLLRNAHVIKALESPGSPNEKY